MGGAVGFGHAKSNRDTVLAKDVFGEYDFQDEGRQEQKRRNS